MTIGFLQGLLNSVAEQGRSIVELARRQSGPPRGALAQPYSDLLRSLMTQRGEASAIALARAAAERYRLLDTQQRVEALMVLATAFAPDPDVIRTAFAAYDAAPSETTLQRLIASVEPPRQEIIRRINMAPGNTLSLVRMREDLLDLLPENPALAGLDADFRHLFSSWFNRGFLVMRRIDWSSPAHILEKIIRYEAVHAIESWDDLRRRIEPPDRRCFAFFHPALLDEPLIFVEVALTTEIPDAIAPILSPDRTAPAAAELTTAVFYSISNCQRGLASISFGHFLIKQVVEELKRELPQLTTFVTLSPAPGFRAWLDAERAASSPDHLTHAECDALAGLDRSGWQDDGDTRTSVLAGLPQAAARYFLDAKGTRGRPVDSVARFHLGNGARLHRLNMFADLSPKGWQESYGVMVNYLYDPAVLEQNHEAFATHGTIAASADIHRLLRRARAADERRPATETLSTLKTSADKTPAHKAS